MNFRHIKKAVAVCVSFAMVISYIPYVLSASAEKSEPETGHTDELLGNYLLNEDFSATQVGSLPADWDKTSTYPGLNVNPGNATGLTDGNIAVAEDGGKYLKYNSAKGDHVLTLPTLGTEDYEMSAELEYSDYESSDKTPTAVQTPIKITYDEDDRSYESGGMSFQDYYTMVDGEYISRDGAAVFEYSTGNKAMKITALATRMNTFPANFTISDSNNGYKGFQPKANTNYKISFKYLVKKASGFDNINVELRLDKNGGKHFNYYNESSYIADTLLTIPANKTYGEWQTFEKEISISSIPQDAKEAYIAFSDGKSWSGGEWYRGEIEMWIDDFTVTAAAVSEINNTYDDGTLPQGFTKWGAEVAEYGNGNNAVKISEYTTRSYDWPACFRILDSNNGNSNFTPIADTKYKISFKYRIDKANSSKPIAIELRYDKPNGNMSMSLDNLMTYGYLKDTLVNSAAGAVTDGWVSFEKEVTFSSMPDGANSVYLAVTTGLADWKGKECAIEVWIDDVSLTPIVDNTNGGFGIITDIANDPSDDKGFTRFKILPETAGESAKIIAEQLSVNTSAITQTKTVISGDEIQDFFNGADPAKNKKITLKAVHYNSATRFYCNGRFVCTVNDVADGNSLNDRVGIYNNGGSLKIRSVKVREIEQIFEGDTLESNDFTGVAVGSIPTGWDNSHIYNDIFPAYDSSSVNNTYVTSEGYLQHKSTGTSIITLSPVSTENFVFSTVVRYSGNGEVGLVTDMPSDLAAADRMTISSLNFTTAEPFISSAIYSANGVENSSKNREEEFSAYFDGNLPDANTDILLTAYHYKDITYFFVNGKFAVEIEDGNISSANRIGFYCNSGTVNILSVTVKELYPAYDISGYVQDFSEILNYNFDDSTTPSVPDNWITVNAGWTWLAENVKLTAYDGSEGKGVLLDSTVNGGGTGALVLPSLGTANYRMTAKVKLLTENYGTFGLLNNITDPVSNSNSAVHMNAAAGSKTVNIFDRSGGDYRNTRVRGVKTSFGGKSDSYDTYTLTAYSYNGRSYYFIDGEYMGSINQVVPETQKSLCGFYTYNSKLLITSVSVSSVVGEMTAEGAMDIEGAAVRYGDIAGNSDDSSAMGIRFSAVIDKNSPLYKMNSSSEYEYEEGSEIEFGIVFELSEKLGGKRLTAQTDGAAVVPAKNGYSQNADELKITAELIGVPKEYADKNITVRGYAALRGNGTVMYYYTDSYEYCMAQIANKYYEKTQDKKVKERLDKVFDGSALYLGENISTFKFTLFSDLHYKENMYASSVEDVNTIVERTKNSGSELMLQLGDFCNDFKGSPEITNAYLKNSYNIPAYGIYGNHELESDGNSMQIVTPLLTNRNSEVVWGTQDGKPGDGSIAYYYFDKGEYRFICTDTNYSYNEQTGEWQHNQTNSYGPPSGNTKMNALGPVQLKWLENLLLDAAEKGKHCIVAGHATFNEIWDSPSSDSKTIFELYSKVNSVKRGTVIMSLNGHAHTNRSELKNNILFLDINTVRNGWWASNGRAHYDSSQTFEFVSYDENGNAVSVNKSRPITELWQSSETWFFESPLSATVTISSTGKITVDGVKSNWLYNIPPKNVPNYVTPEISSRTADIWY